MISALFFIANIYFKHQAGYFDTSSALKPLIHTWSLSLEEQYYIVFPLILITTWRLGRNYVATTLCAITIVSLAFAQYLSSANPTANFYLLPSRAWELMIGAIVAFYYTEHNIKKHRKNYSQLFSIIGFSLIAYSIFTYTEKTPFPSVYTLAPTIGAALIIIFSTKNTLVGNLLSNKVFVGVGLISYSAYLWHQPIFAFARLYYQQSLSLTLITILTLLTLALAYLTWRFIERPFRNRNTCSRRAIFRLTVIGAVFFCFICVSIHISHGFPGRLGKSIEASTNDFAQRKYGWCFFDRGQDHDVNAKKDGLNCWIGSKEKKTRVMLFGDSYAGQYEPLWNEIGHQHNLAINSITTNWCYPSLSNEFTGAKDSAAFKQCIFNRQYLKQNYGNYDAIILSGDWGDVLNQKKMGTVLELIKDAANKNKLVIIMPTPKQFDVNIMHAYERSMLLHLKFDINKFLASHRDEEATQANMILKIQSARFHNVIFIERNTIFHKNALTTSGIPYSLDGGHISIYGAKESSNEFIKSTQLREIIRRLHSET